jgi:hypothetical protein
VSSVFFFAYSNGTIHAPISIIVPSSEGRHVAMSADGCGRIRFDHDFLAAVYHDKSLGYSFIAPMSLRQGLDRLLKRLFWLRTFNGQNILKASFWRWMMPGI